MGDALGAIGRSFRPFFEELGYEFLEIGLRNERFSDLLNQIVRDTPLEFAFSFAGMGADLAGALPDGGKVNLWEEWRIPFISLFGDTPAYFFDRHVLPTTLCAAMYAFPEHLEFRKKLPMVNGLLGVSPPGPLDCVSRSSIDFRRKESGRLLFLKNGNDPEGLVEQWRNFLPPATFLMLAELASDLAARMRDDQGSQIDATVTAYFADRGLHVKDAVNLRLFFVAQLDDYLRRIKSNLLAKVLMDFPVDMYGHNWEHLDFSGKKINFTPGGDYSRSTPMIRDSLGMIDMSPNTGLAPHERPLRAFGMYTLCLTNEQEFFRKNVALSGEFLFKFDDECVRSKVADVIAHPKRYVEVGLEAAETFRTDFPRLRFAERLVETAAALRLAHGDRTGELQPYFIWPPNALQNPIR